MLFCLDVKDKKRMLAPKLKEDELKKLMAHFLESKHISIFGRPLWFVYRSPDKFEEVAKWKLLGGKRHTKYDLDNKDHNITAFFFCVALDICLKNLVSFLLI